MSKLKKSSIPEKPTDRVTEDQIRDVLQGVINIITYHVNNGQRAQITIEWENRNGNIVVGTKVVAHD